jgi:hypothetical protein
MTREGDGYTEKSCAAREEAGGSNFGGRKRDAQLRNVRFWCSQLYVDGRSSGSYSPNMHNKQSCYYRQASWKQFFGAQGEFAFLD